MVSCNQVRDYIWASMGVAYSLSAVNKLLKRLGYSFKQLCLFPSKLDVTKQQEFITQYRELEKNLDEKTVLLFIDGVHPQHNTRTSRVWSKKGRKKYIPSNCGRQKLNLNGAYSPQWQDVIIRQDETINAQSTINLLKDIRTFYADKEKIYCISDNARYYRSKMVNEFLNTEGQNVEWLFLPPYSPNLNLIERLWKYLRKNAINTFYYEKFDQFREAVFNVIEDLPNRKDQIRSFIGNDFQIIKSAI